MLVPLQVVAYGVPSVASTPPQAPPREGGKYNPVFLLSSSGSFHSYPPNLEAPGPPWPYPTAEPRLEPSGQDSTLWPSWMRGDYSAHPEVQLHFRAQTAGSQHSRAPPAAPANFRAKTDVLKGIPKAMSACMGSWLKSESASKNTCKCPNGAISTYVQTPVQRHKSCKGLEIMSHLKTTKIFSTWTLKKRYTWHNRIPNNLLKCLAYFKNIQIKN